MKTKQKTNNKPSDERLSIVAMRKAINAELHKPKDVYCLLSPEIVHNAVNSNRSPADVAWALLQ